MQPWTLKNATLQEKIILKTVTGVMCFLCKLKMGSFLFKKEIKMDKVKNVRKKVNVRFCKGHSTLVAHGNYLQLDSRQ